MRYAVRMEGKPVAPAETTQLSKIENTSTANMRQETSFTDTTQSVLNYT